MDARQVPVDPVTVQAEFRRQGLLRRDGYPAMELVRMLEAVPVPAATACYARLVLTESIARGVQAIGQRLQQLGATPRDPADLFEAVGSQLKAIDATRRRWNLTTGEQVPELPGGTSREPVVLKQALAELDLPWARRTRFVISIGRLSNATAAADHYLTRQAGCPMDDYSGPGERRGLWIGRGADTLHLTGELTTAHERVFRQLLHGLGPDGKPLVSPVLRTDPRGLLDARPLVEAIRGVDTGRLDPDHWPAFDTLAQRVDRSSLATVTVRADVALALAAAAGIDARQVYADRGLFLDDRPRSSV